MAVEVPTSSGVCLVEAGEDPETTNPSAGPRLGAFAFAPVSLTGGQTRGQNKSPLAFSLHGATVEWEGRPRGPSSMDGSGSPREAAPQCDRDRPSDQVPASGLIQEYHGRALV
jgi:hypothetical protein